MKILKLLFALLLFVKQLFMDLVKHRSVLHPEQGMMECKSIFASQFVFFSEILIDMILMQPAVSAQFCHRGIERFAFLFGSL